MVTEHLIALALPYSARAADPFHVSVFVTPKLAGDAASEAGPGGTTLSDFAVFPHWAAAVRDGLTVELRDDNGPIACTPVLDPVEPDVWDALFPGDTPVRANVVPPLADRRWRTFDAQYVHDVGKFVGLLTSVSSIVDPPAPASHPLAPELIGLLRQMKVISGRAALGPIDDERWTELLDRAVGEIGDDRKGPRTPDRFASIAGGGLMGVLSALHEVRRYYDRPESASDYKAVPDSPPPDPLKPKPPEFHERVATVGDHPAMLRRLGLVIDLVVTDVNRLKKSRWLSAKLTVQDADATVAGAAPRVRCEATADGALVTVAATGDWLRGSLAIGDTARFAVLDTDADGTALKTEQFIRVLPRLVLGQANREPGDAASPGLRSQGFTVARKGQASALFDRLARQKQLEQQFATANPPAGGGIELASEDVARGIRVEVFDVKDAAWRSLHARTTTAEVVGLPAPVDLGAGHGFIQGAPAEESVPVGEPVEPPPVNVHEAMFGWEGWSLSVPKPGKRVRNELVTQSDGSKKLEEIVEEPPTAVPVDATNPVGFTHTIVPGTLPTLRYGNDYAFRAWLVDLAGNVRPPAPAPAPESGAGGGGGGGRGGGAGGGRGGLSGRPRVDLLGAAGIRERLSAGLGRVTLPDAVTERLAPALDKVLEKEAPRLAQASGIGRLGAVADTLHGVAAASVAQPQSLIAERAAPTLGRKEQSELRAEIASVLGRVDVADAALAGDVLAAAEPSRAASVTNSVRAAFTASPGASFGVTAVADAAALSSAVSAQLGRVTMTPGSINQGLIQDLLRTITAPRPFLRWDPVPPPTLVPRGRYSEGESQRVVVIRSGVTQDADSLEVTVHDPEAYRAEVLAGDADTAFQSVGQRHLVPPKIGQLQAEYHGAFDDIVDGGSAAGLKAALGIALRENGTLYDIDVADIDDPGARTPVTGVSIVHDPGVDPGDLVTLPIAQGDAPPAGQYVVHDVDDLELPYLPDPLARGVSLVFPDATTDPTLPVPFGIEGFTADYEVDARGWPLVRPFRLTLTDGPTARAEVDDRVIDIALPAGTIQRFRLSSCLAPDALRTLGMWRSLPAAVQAIEIVREAVRDGYLWALTPKENVLLVHAVPRPVAAPRPVDVRPVRAASATYSSFFGGVHLHGPSTEQLTMEASWTEPVDDLGLPAWEERSSRAIAFTTRASAHERLGILFAQEFLPSGDIDWAADPTIRIHGTRHEFGDTKHRMVDYRLRASTRFREYFPPSLLTPADDAPDFDDGSSVVSETMRLSVPSSARPDPPVVHSVVPLFRWSHDDPDAEAEPADDAGAVQPGQPIAERHTRRAGVRIYLQRPWFSSGEGELLGVLVGSAPSTGPYSLWAQDPIWLGASWTNPHLQGLTLIDFWRAVGPDDVWRPGEPVALRSGLTLPTGAGQDATYTATVLGYRPQFNRERRLWYVDVALNPGVVVWPFLRLAVARYQPESVAGLELSSPVSTDFVQAPPERTALVSRLDEHEVRVVVSGPVSVRRPSVPREPAPVDVDLDAIRQNRLVVARLQKADPDLPGDLGWITVDSRRLEVANYRQADRTIAWGTTLGSSDEIPLRRPGPEASGWRVTVEEWERFPGDPATDAPVGIAAPPPVWEQRLVFADEIYL